MLSGYKYVDILVVGGGGGGGYLSGGGGASGNILHIRNLILEKVKNKIIEYNIAPISSGKGNTTEIYIDGKIISVLGGGAGGNNPVDGKLDSNGFPNGGGGHGDDLSNADDIISILTPYVVYIGESQSIAMANNGGGSGGYYIKNGSIRYSGGSGATMDKLGKSGTLEKGGGAVANGDGQGGIQGGGSYTSLAYGVGYKLNYNTIPIQSMFGGGGYSGKGTDRIEYINCGSGGGAAGYGSGGDGAEGDLEYGHDGGYGAGGGGGGVLGGYGGQGIICFYYHNLIIK